jgi:two-component system, LytTR family, sensor kinase
MSALSKNSYGLSLLLIGIAFGVEVLITHYVAGFAWNVTFTDSIVNTLVLAFVGWGILLIIRNYPTSVAIEWNALLIATVLGAAACLTDWQLLRSWMPNTAYREWLWDTLPVRGLIIGLAYSLLAVSTAFRKNINMLKSRFQAQTDTAQLLRDAELYKLRQQLQPHFLYNSLNSISALIMIRPSKAQEMIGKLSDFLRGSVRREAEDKIPIADEITYIQSYLSIEAVRFGDRLQIGFDNECTGDATIPPFLLQPIIENAVKFGVYGNTGTVTIKVRIAMATPMLVVTVTNPYDASVQPSKGTGFGLEGIRRRLFLLYGRMDLLETTKDEHVFTTTLKIPQ